MDILGLLFILPLALALIIFYQFSRKGVSTGYILGGLFIFLVWDVITLVTLAAPHAIPGRIQPSDPGDGFDILFGDLICMMAVLYTVLSVGLAGIYGWLTGRGNIQGRERRLLVILGLAGFLILITFACIYGLNVFLFTTSYEYLLELGYWHWRIIRHGMTPLYVIHCILLFLLLAWLGSGWINKRRSAQNY